jgi:16S rRNA (adenine1518-N6/adenine1519-N6)-dimethyltransferase
MFAKKSLGQNFLMHPQTAQRIALASGVTNDSVVLEIGPGTGMLTKELLQLAQKVIAVETDHSLLPGLSERFATELEEGRLVLLNQDIRVFDAKSIAGPYSIVANIPYYITGELIRQFLTAEHKPDSMTLLVQKEVAVRVARDLKESLLSLSVKAYGTPKYCFAVPRGAFRPAPNVDSAVLSISDIRPDAFTSREEEDFYFSVLRAGFSQKRKRLAKNLEQVAPKVRVEEVFAVLGLSLNTRAETVTEELWRNIAKKLAD